VDAVVTVCTDQSAARHARSGLTPGADPITWQRANASRSACYTCILLPFHLKPANLLRSSPILLLPRMNLKESKKDSQSNLKQSTQVTVFVRAEV
jgi:hypothetical protein